MSVVCSTEDSELETELDSMVEDLVSGFEEKMEPVMSNLSKLKLTFDSLDGEGAVEMGLWILLVPNYVSFALLVFIVVFGESLRVIRAYLK